jgi:hypothetical protein
VYDIPGIAKASNIDVFGKYLAFKTLAHNISRFLSIRQSCRANRPY